MILLRVLYLVAQAQALLPLFLAPHRKIALPRLPDRCLENRKDNLADMLCCARRKAIMQVLPRKLKSQPLASSFNGATLAA